MMKKYILFIWMSIFIILLGGCDFVRFSFISLESMEYVSYQEEGHFFMYLNDPQSSIRKDGMEVAVYALGPLREEATEDQDTGLSRIYTLQVVKIIGDNEQSLEIKSTAFEKNVAYMKKYRVTLKESVTSGDTIRFMYTGDYLYDEYNDYKWSYEFTIP